MKIGVSLDTIIPGDVPAPSSPEGFPVKMVRSNAGETRLIYAGRVIESKCVSDLIDAVGSMIEGRSDVTVTIVGFVDGNRFFCCAESKGLSDSVIFPARISHSEVLQQMHLHDAVLVLSRHESPEDLRYVICGAYRARMPLVVSGHPIHCFRSSDTVVYAPSYSRGITWRTRDYGVRFLLCYSLSCLQSIHAWLSFGV